MKFAYIAITSILGAPSKVSRDVKMPTNTSK